jgi:drug/metabolite transporter superfamily protein YnfA
MHRFVGFSLLLLAALLEAGGDALVRLGLRTSVGFTRPLMLCAGGLVLFAYGCVVNAAPWDFGRLIGVYIVFFFLVAQAIAWLVFGQIPSRGVLLGGTLILIGGVIISAGTH